MSNKHLLNLAAFSLLSASLAACGGSTGSSLPATAPTQAVPAAGAAAVPSEMTAMATASTTSTLLNTSGTIVGVSAGEFTLNSGYPHGMIHIYTTSTTAFVGSRPFVNEKVSVAGTGSLRASLTAASVTQSGATPLPSATPVPAATPATLPNGTSTTALMPSAKSGLGLEQIFDAFGSPRISAAEATADASRYGVVWGARPGMASAWRAGSSSIVATYYMPQETDASYVSWGGIGHSLAWWQANHPDWVLYSCTADGTPTKIPAYVPDLPQNIPLDIHNPAVVDYQIRLAASYAHANGYNGLAFDEVLFYNVGGASAGAGAYGCGIYQNGTFVRRYAGKTDAAWNNDTVAWVKAAHTLLTTDATLAPYRLKLVVNHPAGNISNPNEQAILSNVDADLNETGYTDYGNYTKSSSLFKATLDWTRYAQAHGAAPLTIDKLDQSTAVTSTQLEYSIATYLMGNEGGSGLFVGNASGYGVEQYHSQYAINYGTACGAYYGGATVDASNPDLWYRRYSNALVVVNSGSTRTSEVAKLPAGHTYRDIMGRTVANPLTVANHDAYVLLTTNGCN